jgi:hypothetical protein
VYRSVDVQTLKKADKPIGFWAPAGNMQSKNLKVVKESKLVKEQQVWQTRKR